MTWGHFYGSNRIIFSYVMRVKLDGKYIHLVLHCGEGEELLIVIEGARTN